MNNKEHKEHYDENNDNYGKNRVYRRRDVLKEFAKKSSAFGLAYLFPALLRPFSSSARPGPSNRNQPQKPQEPQERERLSGEQTKTAGEDLRPISGFKDPRPSKWFISKSDRRVQCTLCPKQCLISPGERGQCRVRENRDGQGYTLAYGNPCLVQLDPVERKPYFHVLPGSRALSVSTAGCPLACKFCEVWDMALVGPEDVHAYDMPPHEVIQYAKDTGAQAVSYAFGEPIAFFEYMLDIAVQAKKAGFLNLLHTSGYLAPRPLQELSGLIDAVNIDLKSMDPDFYRDMCGAELKPVLDTLKTLKRSGVHIEITRLVIPTLNDDPQQIKEMCQWILHELGPEVPLNLVRFYPLYKLANLPPTPVSTLDRARETALQSGLQFVYVSRVTGQAGEDTYCPGCGRIIIKRLGFMIEEQHLSDGACSFCNTEIPGIWA